ncbi:MAG: hypothetical protein L0H73_12825 [Nitrococcus sp.]|nr:hypothetical protein [Nitrococcus sp.]
MPKLIAYVLAAIIAVSCVSAAAGQPGATRTSLSDAEIERRLDFIEQRLDASELHAQVWYWSWLVINGGAMVGLSVGAGLTDEADDRAAYIPQAVLAALGVADLTVIRPIQARFGAAPIRSLPGATRAQRLYKLERAEALLRANAMRAEGRKSWLLHLANFGLNAAAGAATYATGRSSDALVSFVTGVAAGELYIWSEPGAAEDGWQDYQRFKSGSGAPGLRLSVVPGFGQITLELNW